MNDPKYRPVDGGLVHVDGGYRVPRDEPCMVFRGKDVGALLAIVEYIEMLEDQPGGSPVIQSHLDSSLERLEAFYSYQANNPDLQSVGCSRRSHADTAYMLDRAAIKLAEYNRECSKWRA